jgi:uncharacterized protein (DUF2237 family)|tara:strand:+ start:1748 stop:2119 length:372 start_codon:yes stop_codon:yes gene_type:complete
MDDSLNIFGEPLKECSNSPMTGFFRNGCCDTSNEDYGSHTVCILATKKFLDYSASVGNDLSTPMPAAGFTGLNPGDQWCLCAPRWQEALEADSAPKVVLISTHIGALNHINIEDLKKYAVDLN